MTSLLPERLAGAPAGPPRVDGRTGEVDAASCKHVQVREYVRSLADGLAPGAPMPSERELVARFGVARMTVRQALDVLVGEGVLERVPGRGTFVAERRGSAEGLRGFGQEMAGRGMLAEAQTLHAVLAPATPGVARALAVGHGEPVWHWRRLRLADGRPLAVEDSWFAASSLPDFDAARPPTSLFDALGARGLRPVASEDSVAADLASPAEARQLGISRAAPVLRVARRGMVAGRPVVVTRTMFRADRYTFWSRQLDGTAAED
ncbi:GntR family transcriptional regulator [uncultured Nocardioides sp.]|uniref:GntR family transcriptional regulator n=1 Tax=uncultured Nocardioides sp. TaxID=198441 RepID=UPI0026158B4D|nr:GntR family transcriptional regulator [uncultured Nocardioides sp.]